MAFTPPTSLGVGGVAVAVTQGTTPWVVGDGGGSLTVDGPLTDAELRAAPVDVTGPLTDAELRAEAVPVSVDALPLPDGAASEETLAELAGTERLSNVTLGLIAGALDVDASESMVDDGT